MAEIGPGSGAFHKARLNPDGTESKVWIEPLPEAGLGLDYIWEAVWAFFGVKCAPRAWDTCSAKVLASSMDMEHSRNDDCLLYRFEPLGKLFEEKAGKHIDDFLVTGPEQNVEPCLKQATDKLNMHDAVRLYKNR